MRLTGYTTQEGTVKETKGDTIWLTRDGKDFPVVTGSGTEQVRVGDQARVLLSPKGEVLRIFNQTADLVIIQRDGKSDPGDANRAAINAGIKIGLPVVGLLIGALMIHALLGYFLLGDVPKGLRGKAFGVVVKTTFGYFVPWIIGGMVINAFHSKVAILNWFGAVLIVFGPGYMVYRGVKKLYALEAEYADALTRKVREG